MVKGIVDFLKKNKIKVFGPNKYASKLEGSKAFMKMICAKIKFQQQNLKFVKIKNKLKIFKSCNFPLVVKADGLAAGKGVTICKTKKS